MSITMMLEKGRAPLERLALARVQLDMDHPFITLETGMNEGLLYMLVGTATVYANGICLGTIGGRKHVQEQKVHCIRFPAGNHFSISALVGGFAADFLWLTCQQKSGHPQVSATPYLHMTDTYWHSVGEGTHGRIVAEVPKIIGYEIDTGETFNPPGAWSSYPPHADQGDIARFGNKETSWEECFYCVCEKPGVAMLNGVYANGSIVNKIKSIYNGEAYVMPLGSHPIVAHPASFLWYFWAYCGDALEKIYRKFSDDIGTYRK